MSGEAPSRPSLTPPGLPEPIARLDGERGYRRPPLPDCVDLRLDGNEGMRPDTAPLRTLATEPGVAETLRRYPVVRPLEAALAERHGMDPERVLVLAGGDEVLDRAFRAYTDPSRNAVWTVPSFEMIPHYARISGCEVRNPMWTEGPYPLGAVLQHLDDRTGVVVLVSPNNPTGGLVTEEDLRAVSAAAPRALVVLDHAYAEFTDHDLTRVALELPNVLVLRTLSKAYGLAGLRVGYALGDPQILWTLRAAGGPYSVPSPSIALALRALQGDQAPTARFVARVRDEREELAARLRGHGFEVEPSEGNFVLARGDRVHWLRDGLLGLGIAIRTFPGKDLLENTARITCPGDPEDFRRLVEGIDAVLAPQAIAFALDGVLADTSRSGRETVLRTAAAFGVVLDDHEVAELEGAVPQLDRVEIVRTLLARNGVDAPSAEIAMHHDRVYAGTLDAPGLVALETALLDGDVWRRWQARLPRVVCAERSAEAITAFLRDRDLEDTATSHLSWPTPRPDRVAALRAALAGLGARRGWFVGSSPEELATARDAGLVPLAVVPPGRPQTETRELLQRSGAARVLHELQNLEELIP